MPTTYKLLSQEERDEIIANTLKAQERDIFTYQLNIDRYSALLEDENLDPEYKAKLETLLESENREKNRTESIYTATLAQAPTQAKLESAITRLESKEVTKL